MITEGFFPTLIHAEDVQLDNKLFEQEIIEWSKKDKGVKKTNVKGWHSQTNMFNIPVFKPLVDELFKMQHQIYEEERLDRQPKLGNMWANINYSGGYNKPHIHPNSLFSGVYYIKAPKNCGRIRLWDPRGVLQHSMTDNRYFNDGHEYNYINVEEGMIIYFPSWLEHDVEPSKSNEDRISVAFNLYKIRGAT